MDNIKAMDTEINSAENLQVPDKTAASVTDLKSKPVYDFFKRVFDIVGSLVASVILLIPMIVISLIIMLKDGGKPFYLHKRIGKNNKQISIWKFRSMKEGADDLEKMLTSEQLEQYKKEYKLEDDPRLIGYKKAGDGKKCFGARLRRLSIDELPQIFFLTHVYINVAGAGGLADDHAVIDLHAGLDEQFTPVLQVEQGAR